MTAERGLRRASAVIDRRLSPGLPGAPPGAPKARPHPSLRQRPRSPNQHTPRAESPIHVSRPARRRFQFGSMIRTLALPVLCIPFPGALPQAGIFRAFGPHHRRRIQQRQRRVPIPAGGHRPPLQASWPPIPGSVDFHALRLRARRSIFGTGSADPGIHEHRSILPKRRRPLFGSLRPKPTGSQVARFP